MTDREQQNAFRRRASALGANLALAREAAGLTQGDLAKKAGTSRATIAQIESGEGDPRLSTLGAIADALSVGPFVLLLGKQDIGKLVGLAQKQKELTSAVPSEADVALLDELAASQLAADRRRAARMSSDIASDRGFEGVGGVPAGSSGGEFRGGVPGTSYRSRLPVRSESPHLLGRSRGHAPETRCISAIFPAPK